jgi:hypothetical protein
VQLRRLKRRGAGRQLRAESTNFGGRSGRRLLRARILDGYSTLEECHITSARVRSRAAASLNSRLEGGQHASSALPGVCQVRGSAHLL